ncbi:MAG: OsmC family protein [Anaerolineaceae bacterium]|nr:OsmC family protein [Anaerolineaceae bacterium]
MDFKVIVYKEYKHIEVEIGGYTIRTDQSKEKGGTGVGPSPGKLFLSAVASCTISTAYSYCSRKNLPLPTGMRVHVDEEDTIEKIHFEIQVPADFPENRLQAVCKAAGTCWVKKQWLHPPVFETEVVRG